MTQPTIDLRGSPADATPQVDAAIEHGEYGEEIVSAELARDLERKLRLAKSRLAQESGMSALVIEQKNERIESCEKALADAQSRLAEFEHEPSAWIEHHKAGDNVNWEQVDHPYAKATPLYARKGGSDGTS